MLDAVKLFQLADLSNHGIGGTHLKFIAGDRFRAPIALERATAARDNVGRKITVCAGPRCAIRLKIDKLPRRARNLRPPNILHALRIATDEIAPRIAPQHARDGRNRALGQQTGAKFGKSLLGLACQHVVNTGFEIIGCMVACVRSVRDHDGAGVLRNVCDSFRRLAHRGQAHLRKKVEIVLVHHDDAGPMAAKHLRKAVERILKRGVEHRDTEAGAAQRGCRVERAQRGVRLHLPQLLRVVGQVIGVCQEDVGHRFLPGLNTRLPHRLRAALAPVTRERRAPDEFLGNFCDPQAPTERRIGSTTCASERLG